MLSQGTGVGVGEIVGEGVGAGVGDGMTDGVAFGVGSGGGVVGAVGATVEAPATVAMGDGGGDVVAWSPPPHAASCRQERQCERRERDTAPAVQWSLHAESVGTQGPNYPTRFGG